VSDDGVLTAAITTWLPVPDGAPDLLALLPSGYEELHALCRSVWEADVDAVTLELCRLRIATLLRSPVDAATRDPRAVAAGLDEDTVDDLPAWPTSSRFTDAQRCALALAEQFVIDPHGFTDDDAAAAHEHFTEPQLATLTIAIAVFDALTRVRRVLTSDPAGGAGAAPVTARIAVAFP
jgi:alkylhydroperoxidase family enzyme